jgi:hypothetical protein
MEQGKHLILEVSHFLLRMMKPNFTFITGTVVKKDGFLKTETYYR